MMRIAFVALAFLSSLLFPFSATILFIVASAYFVPFAAPLAGIFADLLYFPASFPALPVGTLVGGSAMLAALLVRRIMKTGIIE